MPTNKVDEITIVPLSDKTFTGTTTEISGVEDKGIVKYTPNGKYEISASSYSIGNQAHNAFNNDDKHWECNKQRDDSKEPYKNGKDDSAYVGFENGNNTFSTPITSSDSKKIAKMRGEWIQIHIPYQAYIQSYRIKTPEGTDNTFPRKFVFAGSNDEKSWTQLDQRNLKDEGLTNEKMFDINTTDKYSYFRLIINGMGPKMSTVKIQEIQLVGTTMITTNPNADTFITLTRSIEINDECNNNRSYEGINMYDKQYAKYITYSPRRSEKESNINNTLINNYQNQERQRQNKQTFDYLRQSSMVAGLFLTTAFIYTLIRNKV